MVQVVTGSGPQSIYSGSGTGSLAVTASAATFVKLTVDVSSGDGTLSLSFNGNGGADTIIVDGSADNDQIHIEDAGSGQTTIHSGNGTFGDITFANAGITSLELDPGTGGAGLTTGPTGGDAVLTIDPLSTSFTAPITVKSGGSLTLGAITAPHGLNVSALDTISAGPAIGNELQEPVSNWTPNASYTNVAAAQALLGYCTPSKTDTCVDTGASGMTVNITVSSSGTPTAALASFGVGYQIDDIVQFDAPSGGGSPVLVQVTNTPEVDQSNVPVTWYPWTANRTYADVTPAATSQDGCVPSATVTSCASAGTGMEVNIAVDAYGNPTATIVQPGTNYAFGDTVYFDPPNGAGTPIELELEPVLVQTALSNGFLPWTASQTYTQVAAASTSGNGSGMTARVTVDANGDPTLNLGAVVGTGYALGDTVTFDPPDGIGDEITATITQALYQNALPNGFTPWKSTGATQTFTAVPAASTNGSGSGMTATVTVSPSGIPTLNIAALSGSGYAAGDTVTFNDPGGVGSPITALVTDGELVPQVSVNWLPNQTWSNVAPKAISGTGSGLLVDIVTDSTGVPVITVATPGNGYQVGETLTFDSLCPNGALGCNTADPIIAQYTFVGAVTQLPGQAWTPDTSYTSITGTGGSGTGMTANITTDDAGVPTATLLNAGTGYKQGDTVTFADPGNVGDALTVTVMNADSSAATAPLISTRMVASGADPSNPTVYSTGNSGNLTLNAPTIMLGPGTAIYTDAINNPGGNTSYTGGDINIVGQAAVTFTYSIANVLPWKVHEADSSVVLDGVVLDGNDVNISSNATTDSFAGYDVFGDGWESVVAQQNVADLTDVADTTLTFADGPGGNGSTITRDAGSWISDNFAVGQTIAVIGSQFNDATDYTIAEVTPAVITLAPDQGLVNESDHGLATVKQLLSSVLPQNTPVMSLDPGSLSFDSNSELGKLAGGSYNASTLDTGLAQAFTGSSLLSDVLPPPFNAFFGVTSHASTSIKTLGTTTITAAGSVSIEAATTTSAIAKTPGLLSAFDVGVTYAESEGTATNELGSGTLVTAGGAFTFFASVLNTMESNVSVVSGTIYPMAQAAANVKGPTGVKIPGPSISVAYGKARSTSSATIDQGASVAAGDVAIAATNTNDFDVTADSEQVAPGFFNPTVAGKKPLNSVGASDDNNTGANQGQGAAVAVSDVQSHATTEVDGSVVATGSVTIAAGAINTTNNAISTSVIRNSAVWETKKVNLSNARQNPGQFGLSAAITYITSVNDAEAHVGPTGVITAAGNLSVTSDAEEPIRAAAIGAGLQESEIAIGGAVSIAMDVNHSNASIESTGAGAVNAGGRVYVDGQSNIPQDLLPIKQYQQLVQFITNETTPGSPLFTEGDFVDAPTLASDLVDNTNPSLANLDPLSLYLWNSFTAAQKNTLIASTQSVPHLTLSETSSPSFQKAGDAINYTFVLANDGNVTISGATITDPAIANLVCGTSGQPATLQPGDTLSCTGSYTATGADVTAGEVVDQASASGTAPATGSQTTGATVSATTTATIPLATWHPVVGNTPGYYTYTAISHLTLTKNPDQLAYTAVGNTINFTDTALNDGTTTLTNVAISDPNLQGFSASQSGSAPCTAASLAPGASLVCYGSYTITQADMTAGEIVYPATATAKTPANATITATDNGFVPVDQPTVALMQSTLSDALNSVINGAQNADLYSPTRFEGVTFSTTTQAYLAQFDAITLDASTLATGDEVVYNPGGGSVPGLTGGATYYVIKINDSAIRLANSYQEALEGIYVPLTSGATGNSQDFAVTNPTGSGGTVTFGVAQVTLGGTELTFPAADQFVEGESVRYSIGTDSGATAIGGLTDGSIYQVHVVNATTIELTVPGSGLDSYVVLGSGGVGSNQSFTPATPGTVTFDTATVSIEATNELHFSSADGLINGEQVEYEAGASGNTAIGGLVSGDEYVVHVVDSQTVQFEYGSDPLAGIYVILTSAGSGSGQSLSQVALFKASSVQTTFPTGGDLVTFDRALLNDAYGSSLINPTGGELGLSFSGFFDTLGSIAQQSFSAGGVQPSELDLLDEYMSRADLAAGAAGDPTSYASAELGLPENITTTYVGAASMAGSDDPQTKYPGKAAISASFDYLSIDNAGHGDDRRRRERQPEPRRRSPDRRLLRQERRECRSDRRRACRPEHLHEHDDERSHRVLPLEHPVRWGPDHAAELDVKRRAGPGGGTRRAQRRGRQWPDPRPARQLPDRDAVSRQQGGAREHDVELARRADQAAQPHAPRRRVRRRPPGPVRERAVAGRNVRDQPRWHHGRSVRAHRGALVGHPGDRRQGCQPAQPGSGRRRDRRLPVIRELRGRVDRRRRARQRGHRRGRGVRHQRVHHQLHLPGRCGAHVGRSGRSGLHEPHEPQLRAHFEHGDRQRRAQRVGDVELHTSGGCDDPGELRRSIRGCGRIAGLEHPQQRHAGIHRPAAGRHDHCACRNDHRRRRCECPGEHRRARRKLHQRRHDGHRRQPRARRHRGDDGFGGRLRPGVRGRRERRLLKPRQRLCDERHHQGRVDRHDADRRRIERTARRSARNRERRPGRTGRRGRQRER